MQSTNQELVRLWANADKRSEFLATHKKWGVWLTIPELGLIYYRYELPKGDRILAMEYQRKNSYPRTDEEVLQTVTVYYLWEGELFTPNPASVSYITNRLKELKVEIQKELRTEAAM